ncbi:MAG: hypothetical protein J2P41_05155 [Blastocatellia bacterium]|nr:hypothetical protein [Blastocatellia bacterium]
MKELHIKLSPQILIFLLLVIIVSVAIVISLILPLVSAPPELKISGGARRGKRNDIAQTLAAVARSKGLNIADPIPTEGSEKTIKLVAKGRSTPDGLDLGLIQGGMLKYLENPQRGPATDENSVGTQDISKIRQIDALDTEALHLLFKPSLKNEGIEQIEDLKGRRKILNLSEKGSGTEILSREVLKLAGFSEQDYVETNHSYDQLMSYKKTGDAKADKRTYDDLPDAVFIVSLLRSPVAQYLIDTFQYRLIPIPYAKALSIDNAGIKGMEIDKHVYGSSQKEKIETIGTTLLLIANESVADDDVVKLLEITKGADFNTRVNRSIPEQIPEYRFHSGVLKYATKDDPIFTQKMLRSRYTLNGLLFFILLVLVPILRYVWKKQKLEQEKNHQIESFSFFRQQVSNVEQRVVRIMEEENPADYFTKLEHLRKELIDIRDKADHEFFELGGVSNTVSEPLQRYINSVISSIENLLSLSR